MVDSAGRFIGDAIGSGQITLYKEFSRAEPGSHENVGTGNTASGTGNTYLDFTTLGTISIPENPDSIGDGATASDYCPLAVLADASARNTSFAWNGGSYQPMVAAFRLKFDDGAGNVFYTREGLIPNYAVFNPISGITNYGFGMQQASIADIIQIKSGTYDVHLQRRWGPGTANGMQPGGDGAGYGMPLKIAANVTCLILKR
jgi:hypothetical protein